MKPPLAITSPSLSRTAGGLTATLDTIILVINENESPTALILSANTLAENTPVGSLIGTISAMDQDVGEVLTYSVSDNTHFEISGDSLLNKVVFDFETMPNTYPITLTVTDAGGLTATLDTIILVTNENESPTALTLSANTLAENTPVGTVIGRLSATDQDVGDVFTYTVSDETNFEISGDSLLNKVVFDFETTPSYNLTLTVTDLGGFTATLDTIILVTNENESPTALILSANSLAENTPVGSLIGRLSAIDSDVGDVLTYSVSDNTNFEISGDSLLNKVVFNFETTPSYNLTFTVTDLGGFTATLDTIILVTNENESPTALILSANSLAENTPVGSLIGRLSATDQDVGDTLTYSVSDNTNFEISGDSLLNKVVFDFETTPSYNLTLTVTDLGGLTATLDTIILVTNENESPTALILSANSLAENTPVGTVIGTISAMDSDVGEVLTYSVSDETNFEISGDSLLNKVVFDFETTPSYNLTLTVTDAGGLTATLDTIILVTNENESPTALTLSANSLAENTPVGSLIGTISAMDQDVGDVLTYSVSDNTHFEISGDSLLNKVVFDFETMPNTYPITLTVTDAGGLTATLDTIILVTNENESPTALTLSANSLAENTPVGTVIGTLSAMDSDVGEVLTYSVSDNTHFEISGDSLLNKVVFDFETTPSYNLTLTVTDLGGFTATLDTIILVTNENESPTALILSANSLAENTPVGSLIGRLSATEQDVGDTLTYSVSDNTHFEISGDSLLNKVVFDFETTPSYNLTLTVTDLGGLTATLDTIILVTNENESPTALTLSANSLAENTPVGSLIGRLSATEQDVGEVLTYSVSDNTNFEISGDSLLNKVVFDFETTPSYNLTLTVTDLGGLTATLDTVILVTNENESPTALTLSANSLAENTPVGSLIGRLSAMDSDVGEVLTYSVSDTTHFEISGDSLLNKVVFDFETMPNTYPITLTVTDARGLTATLDADILVTNVNESPTALTLSANSIRENVPVGSLIGTLSAMDQDVGEVLTYSVSDNTHFEISGDSLLNKVVFDFETMPNTYPITLTVTDAGGLTATLDTIILVTNENESPTALTLSANSLAENMPVGSLIGRLSAMDSDVGEVLTYSVSDNTNFKISGDSLLNKVVFDFETTPSYNLTLTVTDLDDLTATLDTVILVTNENESPTALTLSANSLAENTPVGTVIGRLSATDQDVGDVFTYTVSDETNFEVSGDSLLNKVVFDFETTPSYNLTLTVTDLGGFTATLDTVILVTNENESPTALILSANSLAENTPVGSLIGRLSATDSDMGDTLTYSVSDETNFEISGDSLLNKVVFDFETTPSYNLTLTVTDLGDLTATLNAVIRVIDSDFENAPTGLALSANSLAENTPVGSFIGTLSAMDSDVGDVLTYSVSDNTHFEISGDSLLNKVVFDFETTPSYDLTLTVTDLGGLTATLDTVILVTNENESPTALTLSADSLAENTPVGSLIGTLSATDQDVGDMLTYSVSDNTNFEISGDSLLNKVVFDFETTPSYDLTLTVTDLGGLTATLEVTITVTDDVTNSPLFSIYPNPVLDHLTVVSDKTIQTPVVSIYSVNGRLVEGFTYTVSGNELTLKVVPLKTGLYLLKITHEGGVLQGRFVKNQ